MFISHPVYVSGFGFGSTAHWSSGGHRTTLCGRRYEGSHQRPEHAQMCGNCTRIMRKQVAVAHTEANEVNCDWDYIARLEGLDPTPTNIRTAGEVRELVARRGFAPPPFPEHQAAIPAELCSHGIDLHRHCSICAEERPGYAAKVDKVREIRARVLAQVEWRPTRVHGVDVDGSDIAEVLGSGKHPFNGHMGIWIRYANWSQEVHIPELVLKNTGIYRAAS